MSGGMSRWTGPRVHEPSPVAGPSPWLLSNALLAPRGARTLDVACGRGRHALFLAGAGYQVRAVDRDAESVAWLNAVARRLHLPLDAAVVDLADAGVDFGTSEWELVLAFDDFHRPLFPALVRALKPGGVLICETSPEPLAEAGELRRLVAPLEVVRHREGEFEGRAIASVAARKPVSPAKGAGRSRRSRK